jgi:hypothetical protein
MDYVTNHWGIEHWMIKDLPTKNGSINLTYTQTNQKNGNSWHQRIEIDKTIDGWFVPTMRFEFKKITLNYFIQNAIWWIESCDLMDLE